VAGLGGLGTAVCASLVRAGVGHLILIDFDHVEQSNLNRQILYCAKDVGLAKVDAAAKRLFEIRPTVKLTLVKKRIEKGIHIHPKAEIVADCLDDLPSRFVLDEMCRKAQAVLVHGGTEGLFGQVTTILPDSSVRLSNIYKGISFEPKIHAAICSSCMVVGAIQALEIMNFILKGREGLAFSNKLLSIDLYDFSMETLRLIPPV